MGAPVTKHYFEHNGRKYFRGNAENVEIGSYGEKKDPIGPDAYLAVQNKVKHEHLAGRVRGLGGVSVAWDQAKKADVEANGSVQVFGLLGGERAVAGSFADLSKGKCKLVGFAIDEGPLRVMLNTDADGARNYLADEGGDGRIASEIWVAMEAELSEYFGASASYSVSANVAGVGLNVKASANGMGSKTITLSKGSTFAYMLHKVKDWDKGKDKIENLEEDYKGMS